MNGQQVEICDEYQYLGIKFKPSGSMSYCVSELASKAKRAWFSISNIIFKHKRMDISRVFSLLDSPVMPIALYGCEFWLPHIMQSKAFNSLENLLEYWEKFQGETINQQCSRIILSVHIKLVD